jgi:hypothetical protein
MLTMTSLTHLTHMTNLACLTVFNVAKNPHSLLGPTSNAHMFISNAM